VAYISYTGWKTLDECPRHYGHKYVFRTPLAEPDNKVNSLYGSGIGAVFELFYNDRVWKREEPAEHLLEMVEPLTKKVVLDTVKKEGEGSIRWKDPKANYKSFDSLILDIKKAVPFGVETIRANTLVGLEAGAEVKLDQTISGYTLGGRADFVVRRARHHDLVILDGKGSKYRDQYVDRRQLLWYAMLWKRKNGFVPDRLGFVFWRFEPAKALDWIDFTPDELPELEDAALTSLSEAEAKKGSVGVAGFEARPGKACKFCPYRFACPEGAEGLALTLRSGVRVELPLLTDEGSEVEEVGL
jgi:hypothetical protein